MRTRDTVRQLLEEGKGVKEIARLLGISQGTVGYHKRRLQFPLDQRFTRRYDWEAIQAYYDEGHSKRECARQFGFSAWAWHYAVKRGAIKPRPYPMPLKELLIRGPRNRNHVKLRLIGAGIKEASCEECGISEWLGEALSLELHHRNGEKHDNRLENLALLCPNCHSQTDSWGGRNAGASATATVTALRPSPDRPDNAA
jgi:5-methylcytosine-specific restriction endonuclease McrA